MSGSRRVTVVFSVLLVVCLAGSVLLLRRLDQIRTGATLEEVLYISSPKALKRMSLGYDGLLADIYWTRAVQYFGNKHHDGAQRYDLLAPLLEITTDARSSPAGGVRIRRQFSGPQATRTAAACPSVPSSWKNSASATIPTSGASTTTKDSSTTWS